MGIRSWYWRARHMRFRQTVGRITQSCGQGRVVVCLNSARSLHMALTATALLHACDMVGAQNHIQAVRAVDARAVQATSQVPIQLLL